MNDGQRIAQEEQRLLEELTQLNKEMEQASELIEPFSESSATELSELGSLKNSKIQKTILKLRFQIFKRVKTIKQNHRVKML